MTEKFNRYHEYSPKYDKPAPYVTLWMDVVENTVVEPDPDDEWDAGQREEILNNYGVTLGDNTKKHYSSDSRALTEEDLGFMPKVGDTVYLVIERHSSGCTFGSTNPVYTLMKIHPDADSAQAWTTSEEGERCKDTDFFGGHQEYEIYPVVVR